MVWRRRHVDRSEPTYLLEDQVARRLPDRKFPKIRLLISAGKYLRQVDLDGRSLEAFIDGPRPRNFLMARIKDALVELVKEAAAAGDD